MKKVSLLLILIVLLISCNGAFERKDPRAVTYREKISDTDTSEIWRNVTYELVNVSYDTVLKVRRERSTLEPVILAPKVESVPKDRVDLNDIFNESTGWDDKVDWNYTEIDEETIMWLNRQGIYWDEQKEYWRKR